MQLGTVPNCTGSALICPIDNVKYRVIVDIEQRTKTVELIREG